MVHDRFLSVKFYIILFLISGIREHIRTAITVMSSNDNQASANGRNGNAIMSRLVNAFVQLAEFFGISNAYTIQRALSGHVY